VRSAILRHREGIFEQFHASAAGWLITADADNVKSPCGNRAYMPQRFAGYPTRVVLFVMIYCSLSRFDVAGGASPYLDEAQDIIFPPDQVNFPATSGGNGSFAPRSRSRAFQGRKLPPHPIARCADGREFRSRRPRAAIRACAPIRDRADESSR